MVYPLKQLILCGNVLGLSNFTVPSLSPCSHSRTISSYLHVKCVYVLLSKIGLATHAFFPLGNIILNTKNIYMRYSNEQTRFYTSMLMLYVI